MAVISLKNKLKSGSLLVGNAFYDPTEFDSIATVTVGAGGSSSITFSSIPSTYKHLQIRGIIRSNDGGTGGDVVKLNVNSDTGTNYSWHRIIGYTGASTGTQSSAGTSTAYVAIGVLNQDGQTGNSNVFTGMVIDLLEYSNTNIYKTFRSLYGYNLNTNTSFYDYVGLQSGNWRSTSAINAISIAPLSGTAFTQYSSFALYGVKG